jgi:hypothetical protein
MEYLQKKEILPAMIPRPLAEAVDVGLVVYGVQRWGPTTQMSRFVTAAVVWYAYQAAFTLGNQ